MLKNNSGDALVKITHDEPLENIDFKDQRKILCRCDRRVFQAPEPLLQTGNRAGDG